MESAEFKAFRLVEAYKFAEENGLKSETMDIREMNIEWKRSYGAKRIRFQNILDLGWSIRQLVENNLTDEQNDPAGTCRCNERP